MNIVIVEDDHQQSSSYTEALKRNLPGVSILLFETATDFVRAIPQLETDAPVFIILDLMLPWSYEANPAITIPPTYTANRGGLFLLEYIKSSSVLSAIPLLIWTAVDVRDEIREKQIFSDVKLKLKSEIDTQDLVNHIRSLLMAAGHSLSDERSVVTGIAGGIDVKPSFFGFSLDVKKVVSSFRARRKRKAGKKETSKKHSAISVQVEKRGENDQPIVVKTADLADRPRRDDIDEQAISDFNSLTHDLVSPLISTKVHLRNLLATDVSLFTEDQLRHLRIASVLVDKARRIIQGSRIKKDLQRGALPFADCRNRQSEIVKEICVGLTDAQKILVGANARIVSRFEDDGTEILRFDRFLTEYCLYEIVQNELRGVQTETVVTIVCKPDGGYYKITLTSRGAYPIDDRQLKIIKAEIFDDGNNPIVYSGGVFDLWVCDKLLIAQGGQLKIGMEKSDGVTTFQILLPRS